MISIETMVAKDDFYFQKLCHWDCPNNSIISLV
jgi:hypothetical protein